MAAEVMVTWEAAAAVERQEAAVEREALPMARLGAE
jgi:hypothetical protein